MVAIGVRGPWPAGGGVERQPPCRRRRRQRWHSFENRQQRLAAQRGAVGRGQLADLDLLDPLEALRHDFHVRLTTASPSLPNFFTYCL